MTLKKLKKGYHYTSKKNWEQIQKDGGMKRYTIDKEEMRTLFPKGISGIWLWKEEPTGTSHAGNIMYQVGAKGNPEIVKLEVEYNPRQLASYKGSRLELSHTGAVENWEYHYGDCGIIAKEDIPLKHIRVIGHYNTIQRLQ